MKKVELTEYDIEAVERVFDIALRDNSITPASIYKMTQLRDLIRKADKIIVEVKDDD